MDRTERFYKIETLLKQRSLVTFQSLLDETGVSRATLTRDLAYLRDRMALPIVLDRAGGGYRLEVSRGGATQVELPGMWFSDQEIHALLTMQHLLVNLDPGGILKVHVEPLMARLNKLLGAAKNDADEVRRRVLIIGLGKRPVALSHFERIGSALLRRKRLHISYAARSTEVVSEREISPQRLVHYRENWYLDAWCHVRRALRSFAVDAIQQVENLDLPAREVATSTMDEVFGPGYGIFSGKRVRWARLRFSAERARWVSLEAWHPRQKGRFERAGTYRLEIPYSDHRELIMDVLKHGSHCEVLRPEALRVLVKEEIEKMGKMYGG
jgi:predicted DNA-binding transcriptional regulator YafY